MEANSDFRAGKTVDIESLATAALDSRRTDDIFVQYRGLFAEICARWIQSGNRSEEKIAAFGRIIPFAPYLAEHAERFLANASRSPIFGAQATHRDLLSINQEHILPVLLGIFRLLSHDCRNFAKFVRPLSLESLFHHESRSVRYLAVRNFGHYLHAADHATQDMVKRYVGDDVIEGVWEGQSIDYHFLPLWEERRWSTLQSKTEQFGSLPEGSTLSSMNRQLSTYTVNVNGVLLPRLDGAPSQEKPVALVSTTTTESNLRRFAAGLLGSGPLLLTGLAGSGKTVLIRHIAWQLNKLDTMVTLHLNEQSDSKLLIGMYATGAKPGTFSWRPGVLTTAVREGRWIFIEDLDRAPNEVISTLLPLIEQGELLVPSRGETIRAARGFRIIASMRSTMSPRGQEIVPRQNMIGHRFWNSISVQMLELDELEVIISTRYSVLKGHISGIMRVYSRLLELFSHAQFSSENGTSLRALTPRDLIKWCDRIATLLAHSPPFNTSTTDDIFMEAMDCFAGSLRSEQARFKVMACVAEELHIDPQRRDHLLTSREIKLENPNKSAPSGTIRIGRARLSKYKSRKQGFGRLFSTNDYTLRLLEKVAVAVDREEPLLLVGETGTGKTTCIQYLAEQLGRKLVAFNLSQQSESGDLLGGYKPVNVRSLVIPLKDEFDDLFDMTFSRKKNQRFLEMVGKRAAKGEWKRVCMLWREALKMVDQARKAHESQVSSPDPEGEQPKKKRKVDSLPPSFPKARWEKFATDLHDLEAQLTSGSEAFAFSFLEGSIVKAVRNGDWVLLDEINLASPDTLEAIADLLGGGPDGSPSILLTETGNVERVVAHPNFRVFAAMNPATDVGKKDLPPGIRSRLTEIYVESPDSDAKSLRNIVEKYLNSDSTDPAIVKVARDVTNLYLEIQRLAKSNMLVDGADQKAHFSLRTLTRTLSYAREITPLCSLQRALYEGFHMSFLTFLAKASEDLVAPLIKQYLFGQKSNEKSELGKPLQQPSDGRSYVRQGHYWLRQGSFPVEEQPYYIITPFVQRNMNNLIRATSTRKYPVLIQGPTSSGKTSMIEYLAKRSGNKFVRINNHEHTDLQEYLGSYISGTDGKLTFQEGILVRALRDGHWIVLDELNLAPTDVLEALNRLLDDNRELLIPETQEVVRPHEDFMLFATQNPAGLYGGRKMLSRAFRNRFLELHFDDIPVEELTEILHRRTTIPESWCKRIVNVYRELSTLRQENRLFEQKSFATLRDLFRWAQRKADTVQDLANNGYMLLAERVRKEEERHAVKKIIETVMSRNGPRVSIDEEKMYSADNSPEMKLYNEVTGGVGDVVWTRAMRRLFILVSHALRNNEPVLLVGETGCGKTTVCQMLADAFSKQLHIVNAHQNTETGDLIGAQRPIRNRAAVEVLLRQQLLSALEDLATTVALTEMDQSQLLEVYDKLDQETRETISVDLRNDIQTNRIKAAALFEWADGSLVHAMKTGQFFLLDEISLADDSVLERLNSVLESSRTLLLAEKGPMNSQVLASDGFQFLATMNPGGDYGKRELSPALRNRFTEIWVPSLSDLEDILQIVQSKLTARASQYAGCIVSFAQWFNEKYNNSVASSISIRDTLAWVTFINQAQVDDLVSAIVHGGAMVFIDTLGANPAGLLALSPTSVDDERRACVHRLTKLLGQDVSSLYFGIIDLSITEEHLRLGSFSVPRLSRSAEDSTFSLEAPTTRSNAMRVVRALQLPKPILLEGNPGVGKTTLVTAVARAVGKPLTRLNLSEQTDLMDLFGSDAPVEGGQAGTFAWRDAPFLKAMKNGDWVLLDEMNLASQSILEGLNAVLDHRGQVYISELDQTFQKHPDFRVFAAQNPHHQGGGRKGLPASFVNRFTVVYADVFRPDDLSLICTKMFPHIEIAEVNKLISFVAALDEQVVHLRAFGALGSPWEFNLRDTLRWLQLLGAEGSARDFLDTVFIQRFRSESDRSRLLALFEIIYGTHDPRISLYHNLTPSTFQVGLGLLSRNLSITKPDAVSRLKNHQLGSMEALMVSVKQNWPVILVGPPGSGKSAIIAQLASFTGEDLQTFAMNADIDAMDLVGGYEQVDPSRDVHRFKVKLSEFVRRKLALSNKPSLALFQLLEGLESGINFLSKELLALLDSVMAEEERGQDSAEQLYNEFLALLQSPIEIEGARFQWVDGILIQALERGKWLVLDNANLCSSAVLDRLNSLLEPNGYLSINEHATADGEARIIKPHPNFRIFLTMDPRFGELSRAMRNRAIEIYLLPTEGSKEDRAYAKRHPEYPLDSKLYRFRHFNVEKGCLLETLEARFEHLSFGDSDMLPSFRAEACKDLVPTSPRPQQNGIADQPTAKVAKNTDIRQRNAGTEFVRVSQFLAGMWVPRATRFLTQIWRNSNDFSILPYHPFVNELLRRSLESKLSAPKLSTLYDFSLDLWNMKETIELIPPMKFERRLEKQKLPAFLHAYWRALMKFLETHFEIQTDGSSSLKSIRVLFWAFCQIAQSQVFDRAMFQTHLKMLNSELQSLSQQSSQTAVALQSSLSNELSVFGSEVQLKTGLGMERIWRHFKPQTPNTFKQLQAILNLEELADQLDATMWKLNLRVDEMVQMRERFASSLQFVKEQDASASELITILERPLRELEQRITEEDVIIAPYFQDEFEGLCQFYDILCDSSQNIASEDVCLLRAKSSLLAQRPTKLLNTGPSTFPAHSFLSLQHFLGLGKGTSSAMVLQGRFHVATLRKIQTIDEVPLSQLDRFESELQIFSQQISLDSDVIARDHYGSLFTNYQRIVNNLCASHRDAISITSGFGIPTTAKINPEVQISASYRQLLEGPLIRCIEYQEASSSDATIMFQAWIDLALVGLSLYIPNYPHDPALRPMIERKLFNEEKSALMRKLQSLRQFQIRFTGQDTSFRIRETEREIIEMGFEPPVPSIARPNVSELDALQGEFTNLLSIIQPLLNGNLGAQEVCQDATLHQNISRTIDRLAEGYRSYDDIIGPAIGFLVCLKIGLSLGSSVEAEESHAWRSLKYLTHHTPLFGLYECHSQPTSATLVEFCEQELVQGRHAIDLRWHTLRCLTIIQSVEPAYISREQTRGLIQSIFSSFFSEWKEKLLQDQEKEAKNSSLYTFKGTNDDEEDKDYGLFPDYEEEDGGQRQASSTSREHAICLADMHAKLFLSSSNASEALRELIEWCTLEMVRVSGGEAHGTTHDSALPSIFLALEKKSSALSSSDTEKICNFYFDANIPESKRLVTLVHRIQHRYRQIRKIWPEHATLSDVLRTCDETLAFRHVDPVAKFITKAEKLHGYMHEWQQVASREFSTAPLYDDLTKLLVNWRQLELTTWAHLFDVEVEKCQDDAKSWFFIAYETMIAATESIQDEQGIKVHANELLKTLEGFFLATTLGQFEQRIKLLEQFQKHITMRMEGEQLFGPIHLALTNFIAYFSRLRVPVQETLAKGRQALEKEVHMVIKLASWKDVNIEALKQSAISSHRKLSKLVRKFRALLKQPVSGILQAGFPEADVSAEQVMMTAINATVDPYISEICERAVPTWNERPTRFKNLLTTISLMRNLSSPSVDVVDGGAYMESFITNLVVSITQLQKETPTALTDANKETVQHLKTRKRKLYADTMKELRQMGIQSNLSSNVLAKQDELASVLASLRPIKSLKSHNIQGSEYFLHKALSIMSQVRNIAKEHSGDLTSNDVARSIGYLEGLLHATIRQRELCSRAAETGSILHSITTEVSNFCTFSQEASLVSDERSSESSSLRTGISWLSMILKTGADITLAQAKLGKTNDFDVVIRGLQDWSTTFSDLAKAFQSLPMLPPRIWADAHLQWDRKIREKLPEFRHEFKAWIEQYPMPRATLKQIQPYVLEDSLIQNVAIPDDQRKSVEALGTEIFSILDTILGAMQDVETALKELPTSTEDATWLIKEENALSAAISALYVPHISTTLETVLHDIRFVTQGDGLRAIATLFSAVQPIIKQYLTSHNFLVEKFEALHLSTTKLFYRLAKSFIQVGKQGFCTPPEKSNDPEAGKNEQLESGTGLGEGEGAQDISKDIEEDEDLEDLAQQKGGEREGSIEEEDDAVDMGENEMAGDLEDVSDKEEGDNGEGEGNQSDLESEVGSVDGDGPSAVDEKMWDEGGKEDDAKDKEGRQDVGTENKDEQVAAEKERQSDDTQRNENEEEPAPNEDDEMDMEGEDQEENVGMGETEKMDLHAKEEETLDLPDELNIDGNEDEKDRNDDLDDMDMGDEGEEEMDAEPRAEPDTVDGEIGEDESEEQKDTTGHIKEDEETDEEQDGEEPVDDDVIPMPDEQAPPDPSRDTKDDQKEPNAEAGAGLEANEEAHQNQDTKASASAANREDGAEGESAEKNQETNAEDGATGQTAQIETSGHSEETDSPETQSFKKLGDVLEKWYNQQRQISDRKERDETQIQQVDNEVDMANADFEHLPDEEALADTQALGTATEEQAKALDNDMAMAVDEEETIPARPEDRDGQIEDEIRDDEMEDLEPNQQDEQQQSTADGRPQAFVGEQKPLASQDDQEMADAVPQEDDILDSSSVHEVEAQLELTHLGQSILPTPEIARALWLAHESATHSLSQQLTEHLRLILAPTLATKLRGDFRTGKRLNLKRIIPYIASGYKRDKIWLRRSMPSKRNYQVMIALDDSRSMAESGASNLALKTLTLVTRSLSMLEVGEVSVVGFGEDVNVAHDFDKPFTSEAGVRVFEQFGFAASKTNVRGLVQKSLDLFAEARRKGPSSAGEDLWQLMLVVSDGICDSHEEIQRQVRRAQEERVMIVFIIIDATAAPPIQSNANKNRNFSNEGTQGKEKSKEKTSILDLQSVEISPEGKVVRWKYMEKFPFRYYLVVRDVRELPGVLASALRQWFGEVTSTA